MILDKENYESRGPLKGFFYFIWTMLTAHRPEKDKGLEQQIRGIPLLVLDQDDKLVCRSCRECEAVCPTGAIRVEGEKNAGPSVFELDPLKCTSCMECVDVCPTKAIKKGALNFSALHREGAQSLTQSELIGLYRQSLE